MARLMRLLVAAALCLVPVSAAHGQGLIRVPTGFMDRQTFLKLDVPQQSFYVLGVVDGMLVSSALHSNQTKPVELFNCLSSRGVKYEQLRLTTLAVIGDHPEQLDLAAHTAVFDAVRKICPDLLP